MLHTRNVCRWSISTIITTMTREEITAAILDSPKSYILAEMPTSFGKSKIALQWMSKHICDSDRVLIVVPRLVLINNWKDEFKKWGYEKYLCQVTFVTYVSFPKKADAWNIVIFDECHHLSERCRESLSSYNIQRAILLSATVKREFKREIGNYFPGIDKYYVGAKNAIDEGILPDPKVLLLPLTLDNTLPSCEIIKNKSKGNPIVVQYKDRWRYKDRNRKIIIKCTPQQYYDDCTSFIEWCRKRIHLQLYKNMFLHKSGERLKWLSNQKTAIVRNILSLIKKHRTLTFCNSIAQTEQLGSYCINSKNKDSRKFLDLFNTETIDHITACNMLDEGVNLHSCRIGVYASLNSSERMITQKLGRILRHRDPIIIIPYYVKTRDEEIVKKMCEDYNPQLITVIHDLYEFKLWLKNLKD